jgi:5-aminolevulinate synthase
MAATLVRFEWHGDGPGSGTGPPSYTLHPSPPNDRSVQQGPLPPVIAAGALASIRHLKQSQTERQRHQERAAKLKRRLTEAGLPVMMSPSHIVPVLIGDPVLCKGACDALLQRHHIYVQPINYPTVPRGTERLRLTPTPLHDDDDIDALVAALGEVWTRLTLRRAA